MRSTMRPPSRATETPRSDDDWTIRSINIHGLFLERWCQEVICHQSGWELKSVNYPVEFPKATAALRGEESALDARAELPLPPEQKLTLLIECKKHNPEFVNWIFFRRSRSRGKTEPISICRIENRHLAQPNTLWNWVPEILLGWMNLPFIVVSDCRETREKYGTVDAKGKTKTANNAISDAAYQIALARQAIVLEETRFSDALSRRDKQRQMPWTRQVILPAIVTSARLRLCDFDPQDVNPRSGEIPLSKAAFSEHPMLVYEYPVPHHLQLAPASLARVIEQRQHDLFARMHILVIQSESFRESLGDIQAEPGRYLVQPAFEELVFYDRSS